MGTVLAAAGGGEGGVNGSAPEARRNGHKERKRLIFPSLAALAAISFSLAALARSPLVAFVVSASRRPQACFGRPRLRFSFWSPLENRTENYQIW